VSGVKIAVPEQDVSKSPPLSMLPACEDCVGALDGDGPSLGIVPIPSASSLGVPVVGFPLGTDRDASVVGCSAEDGSTSPVSS
jgi:hypothetical protein